MFMKSWEQEFNRHRSSCSPQLLRHPFTTMHTYTVTLDIASHQNQIVYIVLSNKMLSKIVQSFCLQSLYCNNEYTPSWHLSTFYKMRGFIDIWCFARLSSRAPRSWREFAKCRFTHFPSIFSLQVDTYAIQSDHLQVVFEGGLMNNYPLDGATSFDVIRYHLLCLFT